MKNHIYKILGRSELENAQLQGVFQGSQVDRQDGFIHFSTASQAPETAAKHFAGRKDLVLLTIDTSNLPQDQLKWEPSRGGALFPHLYGPLYTDAISRQDELALSDNGRHIFPAEIQTP